MTKSSLDGPSVFVLAILASRCDLSSTPFPTPLPSARNVLNVGVAITRRPAMAEAHIAQWHK